MEMFDQHEIPDFSGDDFAGDPDIQKAREAERAYRAMVDRSFELLAGRLKLEDAEPEALEALPLLGQLEAQVDSGLGPVAAGGRLHVALVTYHSGISTGKVRNEGTEQYLFGHLTLERPYPTTTIVRESLRERISNLFVRAELDFPQSRKFCRTFYVLTEDRQRLGSLWQLKDLDVLAGFREMEVWIKGQECLFRVSRRPVSEKEAEQLAELSSVLSGILS